MNCKPTEQGWKIEYTAEEERLKEFIRTAPKKCGGLLSDADREEYRKEVLWLIHNKPTIKDISIRGFEFLKKKNDGRVYADVDMIDVMYSDDALKDFYAELDKYSQRGCF